MGFKSDIASDMSRYRAEEVGGSGGRLNPLGLFL
jgi:hypothetical protein